MSLKKKLAIGCIGTLATGTILVGAATCAGVAALTADTQRRLDMSTSVERKILGDTTFSKTAAFDALNLPIVRYEALYPDGGVLRCTADPSDNQYVMKTAFKVTSSAGLTEQCDRVAALYK